MKLKAKKYTVPLVGEKSTFFKDKTTKAALAKFVTNTKKFSMQKLRLKSI